MILLFNWVIFRLQHCMLIFRGIPPSKFSVAAMLALENLYTIPKGEDRLPTIFFQGRAVNRPGTTYSFGQTFLLFPFTHTCARFSFNLGWLSSVGRSKLYGTHDGFPWDDCWYIYLDLNHENQLKCIAKYTSPMDVVYVHTCEVSHMTQPPNGIVATCGLGILGLKIDKIASTFCKLDLDMILKIV